MCSWTITSAIVIFSTLASATSASDCDRCLSRCNKAWVPWRGKTYYWGMDPRRTRWIKWADHKKLLTVEGSRGDWTAKKSLIATCKCLNGNSYWLCKKRPVYKSSDEIPSQARGYVKAGYVI